MTILNKTFPLIRLQALCGAMALTLWTVLGCRMHKNAAFVFAVAVVGWGINWIGAYLDLALLSFSSVSLGFGSIYVVMLVSDSHDNTRGTVLQTVVVLHIISSNLPLHSDVLALTSQTQTTPAGYILQDLTTHADNCGLLNERALFLPYLEYGDAHFHLNATTHTPLESFMNPDGCVSLWSTFLFFCFEFLPSIARCTRAR